MHRTFLLSALTLPVLALPILALLVACGGSDAPQPRAQASEAVALPDDLFTDEPIEGGLGVKAVRERAREGGQVYLTGRIGGRVEPFSENRAVFLLADLDLLPCTDHCPTPWDYCCDSLEARAANTLSVQVVDDSGRPLRTGLEGRGGLEPLARVDLIGTVHQLEENVCIINAEKIHVVQ